MKIALVSDTPDEDFDRAVANGASVVRAIGEKPWGQRVGHLRDLNGVIVEICSPMGG